MENKKMKTVLMIKIKHKDNRIQNQIQATIIWIIILKKLKTIIIFNKIIIRYLITIQLKANLK
jgi:hypothetical protein